LGPKVTESKETFIPESTTTIVRRSRTGRPAWRRAVNVSAEAAPFTITLPALTILIFEDSVETVSSAVN
jgi:hypothetical protein